MFQYNRLKKLIFFILPGSKSRIRFIKKHHIFSSFGDNCFYQSRYLTGEPYLVKIHNNVTIAANVRMIPHDVIHIVFNNLESDRIYRVNLGCIEIMDNVFLGFGTVVLPNVKIGPNAIVAAGSVVTKDVPEGSIVGGNPARVIGSFDDLKLRREYLTHVSPNMYDRINDLWEDFYAERKASGHTEGNDIEKTN